MAEYTENAGKAALVNTQLKEAFAVQEYQKKQRLSMILLRQR